MSLELDLIMRSFFFGAVLTTAIYNSISYFSRKRDKIFLGYTLFTLSVALLFFFRRLYEYIPVLYHPLAAGILSDVAIHFVVGSSLLYCIYFFNIKRVSIFYRLFLFGYIGMSILLIIIIIGSLAFTQFIPMNAYLVVLGIYTVLALTYVIKNKIENKTDNPYEKKMIVFLIFLFAYLIVLTAVNFLFVTVTTEFVILPLYAFFIYFFYVNGVKYNSDYRELLTLKETLEQKVKDRTDQLIEVHERKQQFFLNFAHETKTPLTLINSYLEQYMKTVASSRPLDVIKRNLNKLQRDMLNYLDFEKLNANKKHYDHTQTTDFSQLVIEAVTLFQKLADKKNIAIKCSVDERIRIKADPSALDRIVNNLLDNAVKYTNPGGAISVKLASKKKSLQLTVKDSGIGIDPELKQKIFEPYYQISHKKRNIQGVGMGLNIVRLITDELGANIHIESNTGTEEESSDKRRKAKGTQFVITFRGPLAPADDGGQKADAVPSFTPLDTIAEEQPIDFSTPYDAAKTTLLVVEDNRELLLFLKNGLEDVYNVYCAVNGRHALEILSSIPKPDMIISDIMMDTMDGYDFFKEIKKQETFLDVPFIFLTAVSSPLDKIKSLSEGAVDYITKPLFSIEELKSKIQALLSFFEVKLNRMKHDVLEKVIRSMEAEQYKVLDKQSLLEKSIFKYKLTEREQEIIQLMNEGYLNKEIGARLGVSTRTIDNHIGNIFRKTGCQNRIELLNQVTLR